MTKDNRKPWMRELWNYRFSRDGLMTQETARQQKNADKKQATKTLLDYAEAMGWSYQRAEAATLIQQERLA